MRIPTLLALVLALSTVCLMGGQCPRSVDAPIGPAEAVPDEVLGVWHMVSDESEPFHLIGVERLGDTELRLTLVDDKKDDELIHGTITTFAGRTFVSLIGDKEKSEGKSNYIYGWLTVEGDDASVRIVGDKRTKELDTAEKLRPFVAKHADETDIYMEPMKLRRMRVTPDDLLMRVAFLEARQARLDKELKELQEQFEERNSESDAEESDDG
ncbi:MAG: hypothetical protein ACYTFT_12730 [Planctomycetota bacterium]|jgi:hypothetical protein